MHDLTAVARYVKANGPTSTTKQTEVTIPMETIPMETTPTKATETNKASAIGKEVFILLLFVAVFACWIMFNVVTFGIPVS